MTRTAAATPTIESGRVYPLREERGRRHKALIALWLRGLSEMPTSIHVPNQASLHILRSFLATNTFFPEAPTGFLLRFHPRFVYLQPFALAMLAAWGEHWRREVVPIEIEHLDSSGVDYAWRMKLFDFLGIEYQPEREEHEEAGRFIPIRRITNSAGLQSFLADVAPLLHRPEHAQAVQYCLSETIRNVLEHAGGVPAFACAQYYQDAQRVSIGVADCGIGVHASLSRNYTLTSSRHAILEAMKPGVSGAMRGPYGSPENAGAGLFFTKSIAKASRSYFSLFSGDAAFRLRRLKKGEVLRLFGDPSYDRHDLYENLPNWHGTVVAVDIGVARAITFDRTMRAIQAAFSAERRGGGSPPPSVNFT